MGDFTSTVPSHTAGEEAVASKLQTLDDFATAATTTWTAWTPTLTNLTLSNGTLVARYRRLGKTVDYYWQFVLGTTSAVGTTPMFTLPAAPASYYSTGGNAAFPGNVHLLDLSTADRQGMVKISSGSTVQLTYWNATPANASITATAPWTWGTGDTMTAYGTYETA